MPELTHELEKSYFTIGEVAHMIGESPSLLRFWEKHFSQIAPVKNTKGTRKYNKKDIELIKHIHYLVKQKGYTLEGAKQLLKDEKRISTEQEMIEQLTEIKEFLIKLKNQIH